MRPAKAKGLKRINNLYGEICSIPNLEAADVLAQKGKSKQSGVIEHNKNAVANIIQLNEWLVNKIYQTSEYVNFWIEDTKPRLISKLPYYPDRIVHHAIMNKLETMFVSYFTADTYSSIKGRGIHAAADNLIKSLKHKPGTKYCLKLDIQQFYPSINNSILKQQLRRKIKDNDLLWLMDEIIDSAKGLPIGNYLSQYLANFYLTGFDHWLKEQKGVKHYFRYADDIVILSDSKEFLHQLLADIKEYLYVNLHLHVKKNYQVFPVAARGIDFLGYVFFHTHVLLRKRTKQNYIRMIRWNYNQQSYGAYNGWLKHCNSYNLRQKYEGRIAA